MSASPRSRADTSTIGMVATALVVLALVLPLLPGSTPARAQTEDPDEETPAADSDGETPAPWRARARSQTDSWAGDGEAEFWAVDFVDDDHGFALLDGGIGEATLLETVQDEESGEWTGGWQVVNTRHSFQEAAVEFIEPDFEGPSPLVDETVGFAYGDTADIEGAVWKSTDGGRTWSDVIRPRRTNSNGTRVPRLIQDFAFTTSDGAGVVGVGEGAPTGASPAPRVIRSTDGGASWEEREATVGGDQLNAVEFAPADSAAGAVGVAVGEGGTILTSVDGGDSWEGVAPGESLAPEEQRSISFRDVSVVRDRNDDEPGDDDLLAVVVGHMAVAVQGPHQAVKPTVQTEAVLAWSTAPDPESGFETWQLVNQGLPGGGSLAGVTLSDSEPDGDDGLVGYAVGAGPEDLGEVELAAGPNPPTVLAMRTDDPEQWVPAPVDPRATAYPHQTPQIRPRYGLRDVTVSPAGGIAMAVGRKVMLERTPVDSGDPDGFLETLTGDREWRCVESDRPQTGVPTVDDDVVSALEDAGVDVDDAYGEVRDSATEQDGVEECRNRKTDTEAPASPSNFGSTQAVECELDGKQRGDAQFPCVATWDPLTGFDSDGEPEHPGVPDSVWLDEDMNGAGRRLVAVEGDPGVGQYVVLFDPDRLEQRGVPGFGEGQVPGVQDDDPTELLGQSAFGRDTGVVKFSDMPGLPPPGDRGAFRELRAYDAEHERLYLGSDTVGVNANTVGVPPEITAVSLTGKFNPKITEIPAIDGDGRSNALIVNMAYDRRYDMLYVLTETNYRRDQYSSFPTMADSTHVTLHAFSTLDASGDAGGNLGSPEWSLPLEDKGCRSTIAYGNDPRSLHVLKVNHSGDALAFACAGHAGPHFGNPTFEPNTIMTIRLGLSSDEHPSDLEPENDIRVFAEPVGGKVLEQDSVTMEVNGSNVFPWNQVASGGASLWDFEIGGWIGSVPKTGIPAGSGFPREVDDDDPLHTWRGRHYFVCEDCVDFTRKDGKDNPEPAMLIVDTLNVPAQVPAGITENVRLPNDNTFPQGSRRKPVPLMAVPPAGGEDRPRVFVLGEDGAFHVFEDRVAPALERVSPDPDARTFPAVDEEEAGEVKRIGRASAYGTRLWWSGAGTATAVACQYRVGHSNSLNDNCGRPTLSYNWLTESDAEAFGGLTPQGPRTPHGRHTSAVPGRPGADTRELRLGEVQQASLENNKSTGRAQAKATGFFYDGGPADDDKGDTGGDVHRRRGRDPHRFIDAELAQFCEGFPGNFTNNDDFREHCDTFRDGFQAGHEGDPDDPEDDGFDGGFGPYEAAFAEAVDRGMREFDGERRESGGCGDQAPFWTDPEEDNEDTPENEADCWERFDRNDPRCSEDDDGHVDCDERSSVQERAGMVLPSTCLEPAGEHRDFEGSRAECNEPTADDEYGRTEAAGELDGLELAPQQASGAANTAAEFVSVGGSGSETNIYRDDPEAEDGFADASEVDEGIVVETTAWASDVELRIPSAGSLSIGEVRQRAWARAHGREDTATSSREVTFQDVVITGPDRQERFSCGRSDSEARSRLPDAENPPEPNAPDPNNPPEPNAPDPNNPPERSGAPEECDPHEVADVISRVFPNVQATTSGRDTDHKTEGSPGGAQAILRRDPVDVLSDQVIDRYTMWELPALELTVFNDGMRANRLKVDLAGVYAETHYEIGQERIEVPEPEPEPGAVEVELTDPAGSPVSGGGFAVYRDADGDGQVGRTDPLAGECTTGVSGSCVVPGVESGSFVVEQRFAPEGFRAVDQSVGLFVPVGVTETVTFTNAPSSAAVEIHLTDPSGRPLAGGQFGLVADAGNDGVVDPNDSVLGTCVTGEAGTCSFNGVPLGVYVLHQGAAPQGFETADDVAFALRSPGQVARIQIVNGVAVASAQVEIIEIVTSTPTSSGGGAETMFGQVVGLPKVFADILLRDPIQALLFGLTAGLFGAPLYLAVRRRELSNVRQSR